MNLKKIRALVFVIIIYASITCMAYCENKISNVPAPVDYFTGRLNILAMIDEVFTTRGTIVSLVGITGIGKSQIARKYVEVKGERYSIIWQFDCDKDLLRQFDALVKQVNNKICNQSKNCKISEDPHKLKESLFEFLSNHNDWLLIFDNIKKEGNDVLNGNIPQHFFNRNQRIIIASQDQRALDNIIHIRPFSDTESIDLFKKFHMIYAHDEQLNFTRKLAGYPLAIAKVGSFLRENQYISFRDYEILNDDYESKTNKNETDGFESIRFLLRNDIIKINKKAYELLVYAAFLDNNNIIEDILFEICKSGHSIRDRAEFLSHIITLNRYLLIEYKRNTKMINDFKEFEMHDLIQKTLKEGLTEPEKQKYLEDIVVKLNKFLPDDFSLLGKMKDTYPTLVTTLEILSKESQLIKISEIEWLDLNKHLLMLYMYTLDYSKAEKLIDEVDNEIQRIRMSFDSPKKKSIYATYLIYKSLYCDIAYKCDQGVVYLKEALNLVKDLQSSYPNLLYKIYQDYSDAEAFRGNITFAEELLVEAEKISNQIANLSSPERGFLFFIKAKIALYKGDYQDAILFVNKSIEAQSAQKFSALQVKCLALFQLGVIDEVEQLLSGLREELETMAIDHNHEIYGRFYEMMSRSRLSKGDLESAEKYINLSMERLADSASAYAIKGDIEYAKEEYKSALDNYLKALEIYKSRYGKNMQLDHISELYYHIVKAAKQLKHSQHVQKYVHAHDNIFGLKHRRTKELYDLLIHSQLDGSV